VVRCPKLIGTLNFHNAMIRLAEAGGISRCPDEPLPSHIGWKNDRHSVVHLSDLLRSFGDNERIYVAPLVAFAPDAGTGESLFIGH